MITIVWMIIGWAVINLLIIGLLFLYAWWAEYDKPAWIVWLLDFKAAMDPRPFKKRWPNSNHVRLLRWLEETPPPHTWPIKVIIKRLRKETTKKAS